MQAAAMQIIYKGVFQWFLKLVVGVQFTDCQFLKKEKQFIILVKVTANNDGSYSLSLDTFEADTEKTTGGNLVINGKSLTGTILANGTITINTVFSPGEMPMPITAEFTGSNTQSSAQ